MWCLYNAYSRDLLRTSDGCVFNVKKFTWQRIGASWQKPLRSPNFQTLPCECDWEADLLFQGTLQTIVRTHAWTYPLQLLLGVLNQNHSVKLLPFPEPQKPYEKIKSYC